MGGPGSGRHGRQGRKPGGTNTPATIVAMRAGMIAAHRIKRTRPAVCQNCGKPPKPGQPLEWFRRCEDGDDAPRRWLCGACLTGPMVPLRLEDFVRRGEAEGEE